MTWFVVALVAAVLVAFVVITHFSEEEHEAEPDEGHLEDLLGP